MSSLFWHHGRHGFSFRLCTRATEVTLSSNMPMTSMDIAFERGPDAAPASMCEQPHLNDTEAQSAASAGIFYRFVPVIVKVIVYFADECTMRASGTTLTRRATWRR